MYASVRQYTITSGHEKVDEAVREVQAGLGPIISQAPGFIAYYVLDAGNNVVAAISLFESKAAANTADRMVADWIRQHLTSFVGSPPEVLEGEVIAQQAK
jgi:Antibiotic biosynthesis monooxygenase